MTTINDDSAHLLHDYVDEQLATPRMSGFTRGGCRPPAPKRYVWDGVSKQLRCVR
jgi:hypothetical protein